MDNNRCGANSRISRRLSLNIKRIHPTRTSSARCTFLETKIPSKRNSKNCDRILTFFLFSSVFTLFSNKINFYRSSSLCFSFSKHFPGIISIRLEATARAFRAAEQFNFVTYQLFQFPNFIFLSSCLKYSSRLLPAENRIQRIFSATFVFLV